MLYTDSWYIVLYYVYIPFLDIFDNFDFVGIYLNFDFWGQKPKILKIRDSHFVVRFILHLLMLFACVLLQNSTF